MEETNVDSNVEQSSEAQAETAPAVEANPRRDNFVQYWSDKADQIPEKFNDAGAWFDSIQELERSFTQKSQENAELRKQLESVSQAPTKEETDPVDPSTSEDVPDTPMSVISKEETTEETPEAPKGISDSDLDRWRDRFLMNGGSLDDDLRAEIKSALNAPDSLVAQMETMYKAQIKEANEVAAKAVGGAETLQEILAYTEKTSTPEQQVAITKMLNNSETWETTLLGLKAKYEARPKSQEPDRKSTGVPSNAVANPVQPFETKQQMYAAQDEYLKAETPKERQALYDAFQKRLGVTYAAGGNSLNHLR
jgi:hypothetical protein